MLRCRDDQTQTRREVAVQPVRRTVSVCSVKGEAMTRSDRTSILATVALSTSVIIAAMASDSTTLRIVLAGAWLLLGISYFISSVRKT